MLTTLVENFYFLTFLKLFNIASVNIAVKNKLREGINIGYHNFWNILYSSAFPFMLNTKLMNRNIAPIIKI